MKNVSSFSECYVKGQSFCSRNIQELLYEHYDLLILVSSWDKRCCCITKTPDVSAMKGILVLFSTRDQGGLRDMHDRQLHDFGKKYCKDLQSIHTDSLDLKNTWRKIDNIICEVTLTLQRPIRILLDISTCPRYYGAAILGRSFIGGSASNVTVFYAEGVYPTGGKQEKIPFTGGRWKPVPIPFFQGLYNPGKKRFYLVSIGFEGDKTLRSISRADPDRVSVLLPEPGIIPEYVDETLNANRELFESYHIPENQIIKACAADAIEAWEALSKASLEGHNENVYYMCSGTKPHSIALALRAMTLKRPALIYNVPDEHKVLEIAPSGKFWTYEISDITAFC